VSRIAIYARELFSGKRISLDDAAALATELEVRLGGFDLDAQRAVVRDILEVTVNPGRGADGVQIRHLVVTSLSDDQDVFVSA